MIVLELGLRGLAVGALYAVITAGFAVVYAASRTLHLAHGAVVILSGYSFYYLEAELGWPFVAAAAGTVLVASAAGAVLEWTVYRPMRQQQAGSLTTTAIASLGLLILIQSAIAMGFGAEARYPPAALAIRGSYDLGGIAIARMDVITVGLAVAAFLSLEIWMRWTRSGLSIRALSSNSQLARLVGLDANRLYLLAFAVAAILTVPAGIVIYRRVGVSPYGGTLLVLKAAIATIAAGQGRILAASVVAVAIGTLEGIALWKLPGTVQASVAFGLLTVVLIVRAMRRGVSLREVSL